MRNIKMQNLILISQHTSATIEEYQKSYQQNLQE